MKYDVEDSDKEETEPEVGLVPDTQQAFLDKVDHDSRGSEQPCNKVPDYPERDIGDTVDTDDTQTENLNSTRRQAPESIQIVTGHDTVVLCDFEFEPPWIAQEVYEAEEENCDGVYEFVEEHQILKGSNIISSSWCAVQKAGYECCAPKSPMTSFSQVPWAS